MDESIIMLIIIGVLIVAIAISFLINKKKNKNNSKNNSNNTRGNSKTNNDSVQRKDMSEFITFDKIANDMIYQKKGEKYTQILVKR